jgi:hypothetical protein
VTAGSRDGLEGVAGCLIAVHGLALGSQLAQPSLIKSVVQQCAGLAAQVGDQGRPGRPSVG